MQPCARPSARTTTPIATATRQQFDNTVAGFGKLLSWLGKQGAEACRRCAEECRTMASMAA
ncbi:hypothetical protein [Telluribacter sp.]|uniref:hypothetical protein n=1 Tax=Telluribacter sp. TaxID=1978767 RepID=UPI002E0F4ED5|nr:hypothetical protein [Telluribacter sp.]